MARRDPIGIRLLTRNGHDWSPRYPLIVEAMTHLKVRSCLIDGEAVACDDNGLAVFERLRRKTSGKHVFLFAFDLLELDGEDLRREPIETRKATLASLLRGSLPGLRLNDHLAHPGDIVFQPDALPEPVARAALGLWRVAHSGADAAKRDPAMGARDTLRRIRATCRDR